MSPMNTRNLLGKVLTSAGIIALTGVVGLQLLGSATAETVPAKATTATPSAMPVAQSATTALGGTPADRKKMLLQYCSGCHNDKRMTAGMSVLPLDAANLGFRRDLTDLYNVPDPGFTEPLGMGSYGAS